MSLLVRRTGPDKLEIDSIILRAASGQKLYRNAKIH